MVGCGQKWLWPSRSWKSKICYISKMVWSIELIFLPGDTNSGKLKVTLIIIGWAWSNMGMTFTLGHRTLKSAVTQEWFNQLNWFFAYWSKFRKTKSYFNNCWVEMVKYGCGFFGLGTLKSGVSQEWIDELSWFFACW